MHIKTICNEKLQNICEEEIKWNNLRNFTIITTLTMQATPIKAPITTPINITAHTMHNKHVYDN